MAGNFFYPLCFAYFRKMNLRIVLLISTLFCFNASAQIAKKLCISFYNQENLFDTIDNPNKNDEEFLPLGKYKWNHEKYTNKIHNMAKVIHALNEDKGPDFLGICEVESDIALHDLAMQLNSVGLNYKYLWFEGPDERGIDNALIYKPENVKAAKGFLFTIDPNGLRGDQTRGILMCDFILTNIARMVVFINHFPSRREGEKESEFKRLFVAKTLKHISDSVEKSDPKCKIIIMGDFNDYPNNLSISEILGAKKDVSMIKGKGLYNPMYMLMEQGLGSYKYKSEWNFLDQIILNQSLINDKSNLTYQTNSTGVFKQDWMLETEEKYKGNPKRTFGGMKYINGYSDHLPVYLYLDMK